MSSSSHRVDAALILWLHSHNPLWFILDAQVHLTIRNHLGTNVNMISEERCKSEHESFLVPKNVIA